MTLVAFLSDTVADGSFFTEHEAAQEKQDFAREQIKKNNIQIAGDQAALKRGIANGIMRAQVQQVIQDLQSANQKLQNDVKNAANSDPLKQLQEILHDIFMQAGPKLNSIDYVVQGSVQEANDDLEAGKRPCKVGMTVEQTGECEGQMKELCCSYKVSVFSYVKTDKEMPKRLDFNAVVIYRL
jgi:hypothetical protein